MTDNKEPTMDAHHPDLSAGRFSRRALAGRAAAIGLAASTGMAFSPGLTALAQETPSAGPKGSGAGVDAGTIDARFSHHTAQVNGFRMHYVVGGQGDPIVLLHGWPETWYEWRHVMPALAERYTVVAPDLRGAGDSDRPQTGYDKRTMADDISQLVRHLGFDRIFLVGHDIGMMVAYAYAAAQPQAVRRLALLEAPLPGIGPWEAVDRQLWHFAFHRVRDLPEALVAGQERLYLSCFYRNFAYNPAAITPADIDEYVRTYATEGGLRAGFEYYRAFALDIEQNQEYARTPLSMPVLALGGDHAAREVVLASAREVASDVRGHLIERCGHFIADERPDYLVDQLLAFFGEA